MMFHLLLPMLCPAWRPFLDPLDVHEPWKAICLLPPLVIAIALIYKTLKLPTLTRLGHETLQLTLYILGLMLAAALFLWIAVEIA